MTNCIKIFHSILETEKERSDNYFEDKLNHALGKKLGIIEIKREAELKEKEKVKKDESKDKTKKSSSPKQRRRRASIAYMGTEKEPRRNNSYLHKNSLIDQERRLHEAYQLILGEHHKRLNQRHGSVQFELDATQSLASISLSHQPCPCLLNVRRNSEGKSRFISILLILGVECFQVVIDNIDNNLNTSIDLRKR